MLGSGAGTAVPARRAAVVYLCQPGADALAKPWLARLERHARLRLRLAPQETFHDRTEPTVDRDRRPRWKDAVQPMLEAQTRPGHLVVPSMEHLALTCGAQRELYRWAHGLGVAVHCTDPPFFSARDFLGDALDVLVRLEEVHRLTRRRRHAPSATVLTACGDLRKHLADALPLAHQRLAASPGCVRLHTAVREGLWLLDPHTRSRLPREELHRLIHCLRTLLPPELTGPWNDPWRPAPLHGTTPAQA